MPEEIAAPVVGAEGAKGESVLAEEPAGSPTYVDSLTPSGLNIRFTWAPKRKYEIQRTGILDGKRTGSQWEQVPSVTQVLDVLHKPLTWWGQKIGIQGVLELAKRGRLTLSHEGILTLVDTAAIAVDSLPKEDIIGKMLTQEKLSVNHVRDHAGDRGQVVHDAFETWCNTGILPDPGMYSEEEQGYVAGLAKFLRDIEPEPQAAEVMVGSLEHGYAGRYDARLYVPLKCEVVYKHTPKRGDHRAVLAPGHLLVDLKTSSGVYPSHELQLAGYEAASIECGYGPSDGRGIIHVLPDGNYEFFRARALPEDFFAVLSAYRAIEKFKKKDR